jgi:putative spermidine/putrescine transport system permease protein
MSKPIRVVLALAVAFGCLFPFLYLIVLSVTGRWPFPHVWPESLTADHWVSLFTGNNAMVSSLLLSLGISLAVAALCTPAGYLTARLVARHRHKRVLLFLAYAPFVMSPVVLGTCLMFIYLKLHLAGSALGVILAQAMFALGFAIVFFAPFWNREKQELEGLVYTLGGSGWDAFRSVLLPLSRGMLLICFFQTFLISWFQYGLTLLIGAGKVQTLPLRVYEYVNEANIYYAALACCLLVLPPAILLWINKRVVFTT